MKVIMLMFDVISRQGYMTAAQKLQRKKIVNKFRADIDRAYGKK